MAKAQRRRGNLFGFGKKTTHSSALIRDAYDAGRKSGDTARFQSWLKDQRPEELHRSLTSRLKKRYQAGVESLWTEEKKAKTAQTKDTKTPKSVKQEVLARLDRQGMRHSHTASVVKHAYRKGDTAGELYTRVLARNPKPKVKREKPNPTKFDRCVKDVKKSLKKYKRPGNAYAICTKAGTRTAKKTRKPSKKNPRVARMTQGRAVAEIFRRSLMGPKKYEVMIQRDHIHRAKYFSSFPAAEAWARLTLHDVVHNPEPKAEDLIPGSGTIRAWAQAGHRVVRGVTKAGKAALTKAQRIAARKRNPLELAQQRHEEFTGFPSEETLELMQRQHVHSNLTGLAQFVAFNLIGVDGKELPPMIAPGMSYDGPAEEILFGFKGKPKGDWRFDPKTQPQKIVWLTASEQTERDGKEIKQQLYLSGGDQHLDEKALRYWRLEARDMHDNMLIGTIARVWYWTRKTFEADGKERVWFFHDFGKEGSDGVCPVLIYHPLDPSFEIAGGRYYIALPRKDLKGTRGGNVSPGIVG